MPRHRRPPSSELVGWSLAGVTLGFVVGIVLAEWLGPVRRPPRDEGEAEPPPHPRSRLGSGATAARVRQAIEAEESLRGVGLTVIGIAPGVVEVRGWVQDRAARTRLARLVRTVAGVDTLVNSILVRGEDDPPPSPTLHLSGRTA